MYWVYFIFVYMRPYTFYITSSYSPVRLYLYIMCLCAENSVIFAYMCVCVRAYNILYRDTRRKFHRTAVCRPRTRSEHLSLWRSEARASCCKRVVRRGESVMACGNLRNWPSVSGARGGGVRVYTLKRARARVLSLALRPQQPPPQQPAISFSIYKLFN